MSFNLNKILTLLIEKTITWYEAAVKNIPNIIVAIFIFIVFFIIAKFIKNIVGKILPNLTRNKAVISLLMTITHISIIAIGSFISLEIMNLDKTVTSILAGVGVIGLALGFAFQEIASNFVSGVFIAFREPYQLEDIVEINNFIGQVTQINLRTTSITTFQGLEVIIPNKDMFTKVFINYTTTPQRRLDIDVGVSYSEDLEKVQKATRSALKDLPGRIKDKDVEVYFKEFASSSINLSARVWIEYPGNQTFLIARHQAIIKIKETFDKSSITIPFPIRTLDFGIKGRKGLEKVFSHNSKFVDN